MNDETQLEKALKPIWEAQERFYQANKHLTMKQLLEKIEGRHFDWPEDSQVDDVPLESLEF